MPRQQIPMVDGTMLVIGYDPPFETWFALHHDDQDPDSPPRVAIGYHPIEAYLLRSERPDAVIGPYPITDDDLERMLTQLIPDLMGIRAETKQRDCWFCGKPPWRRNDACHSHPFNRLRGEISSGTR